MVALDAFVADARDVAVAAVIASVVAVAANTNLNVFSFHFVGSFKYMFFLFLCHLS